MDNMLGKIVTLLCKIMESALGELVGGPIFDLLEKISSPSGKLWLSECNKFLRKEATWLVNILHIDRSQTFDPSKFIGVGWEIIEAEQDTRSLTLTEVDLTKVEFKTCLKEGEINIIDEERLKRHKENGDICLDAGVFLELWQEKNHKTLNWIRETFGIKYICFFGTPLQHPRGRRSVLYVGWYGRRWNWYYNWLGHRFGSSSPSAVLASNLELKVI
ncbi:MAG: hypothetical protein AAB657_02860 [Patescibacteria group bacterium]